MKDAIKEEIGFFKLLFTICAAIVSLIGWSVYSVTMISIKIKHLAKHGH